MTYLLPFAGGFNNCVFYYGPLHTIGGQNEVQTAIAIFEQFDLIVINDHTGGDLVLMQKIIPAVKAVNPRAKFFGYVALGNSNAGSGDAVDNANRWALVDAPSASGLIDGIFIDEFGHDFPSGTRDQQNAIVEHCHEVLGLPVFVNPWVPTDVFDQVPNDSNNADPLVGANPLFRDIVLVESFLLSVDAASPPARGNWTRDKGRVEYFISKRSNEAKNMDVCVMIGAGQGTGLDANTQIDEEIYRDAHSYLSNIDANWLCVNHGDIGGTSNSFFIQHIADVLPQAIASGTNQIIKF